MALEQNANFTSGTVAIIFQNMVIVDFQSFDTDCSKMPISRSDNVWRRKIDLVAGLVTDVLCNAERHL